MIGNRNFLEAGANGARRPKRRGRFRGVIVGAILSIFGALSYAELGAAIPEAGGEYAISAAASANVGFLFGWMHSIVGRPASAASIAAGGVRFLSFLLPSIGAPSLRCTSHSRLTHWYKPYDFVSPGRNRLPSSGSSS